MLRRLLLVPVAAVACGAAAAAVPLVGGAPRAHLATDVDAPLFAATNLLPGDRRSACVTVRNDGDAAGRPALWLGARRGPLAAHLALVVHRGRSASRGPSCDGFAADALVYAGTLADFPAEVGSAVFDRDAWAPGERYTYRFTITLGDDPAANGLSASWDWRLGADSIAAPRAVAASTFAERCEAIQLAGTARGRRSRTLVRTARVSSRVRAALVLRVLGAAGTPRLVVTTGLRVRGGKTLVVPRWAHVTYGVNGRRAAVAKRRPFRVRIPATAIKPGRNRITVAVRPTRGRPRTTTFTVTSTKTTIEGRTVCVVGA